MTLLRTLSVLLIFMLVTACSLPPDRVVTRKMLRSSGAYKKFKIDHSPEQILNALNMEGEVVIKAHVGKRPVYVKILAMDDGLLVSSYDR